MPTITVFTPTYNRAYILEKCYNSLKNQTCRDFEWLIIDDGSTDNTKELVSLWQGQQSGFDIRYIYKENGGLHTGYNTAIANMDTELSVCIDSDDAMPENAIEKILQTWSGNKDKSIAGIVGLDYDTNGNLIGSLLPNERSVNAASLLCVPNTGDKKYVMRNDLWKKVSPMPVFEGEKNFNPHYFVIRLSESYRFIPVNECLCEVDYQDNGMSANLYNQYINSPHSFAELRRAILKAPGLTFKYRYKTAAHYISSCMIAREKGILKHSPRRALTFFAIPLGLVIFMIIRIKTK